MPRTKTLLVMLVLGTLAGCGGGPAYPPKAGIEFRLGELRAGPGLQAMLLPDGKHQVYVHLDLILASRDIEYIRYGGSENGRPVIDFRFTNAGGKRMLHATQGSVGQPMAIEMDGQLISFATINGPIQNGLRMPAESAAAAQSLIDRLAVTH